MIEPSATPKIACPIAGGRCPQAFCARLPRKHGRGVPRPTAGKDAPVIGYASQTEAFSVVVAVLGNERTHCRKSSILIGVLADVMSSLDVPKLVFHDGNSRFRAARQMGSISLARQRFKVSLFPRTS